MKAYVVGIKGFIGEEWDGTLEIEAETPGKAKYQFVQRVRESWNVGFQHLTCRVIGSYVRKPSPAELAQREADAFNAAHPIGTMVRYWAFTHEGEPTGVAPTRHSAMVLGGHTAVTWIHGVVCCVSLSHVEAVR